MDGALRTAAAILLLGLGAAGAASAADGPVSVTLAAPERFTDFKLHCSGDARGVDALRSELVSFLQREAAPHLRPPATLQITVTDVDMAGEFETWRGPQSCTVRAMREIYAPRIRLTFRLRDGDGHVIRSGDRDLRDPNYLMRSAPVRREEPLHYEKQLVREWIRGELEDAR
jgi:hypothetical protein